MEMDTIAAGLWRMLRTFCSQVEAFTKLDETELQQLLALFYEIRNDDDVAVDTDVKPLEEISTTTAIHGGSLNAQVCLVCLHHVQQLFVFCSDLRCPSCSHYS